MKESIFTKDRVWVRGIEGPFNIHAEHERLRRAPRVIKGRELPWKEGPVLWHKDYMLPESGLAQGLHVHVDTIAPGSRSANHGHQNEALFYILEGRGHEIHDGQRYDWEAGDVVAVHAGCVHQHFNDDPDLPCRMLVIKSKPLYMFFHFLYQGMVEMPAERLPAGHEDFKPGDW